METPLHFEGGLFSDIRSTDGKLLSKVTVDRVQRTTHHGVADSPSTVHVQDDNTYVDDLVKTETVTNQDVFTVKFTPIMHDIEYPRLLTPSQFRLTPSITPVDYLKNDFEDLQSYKIVNSLCKEKLFESDNTLRNILSHESTENSVFKKEGSTRFVDELTTDHTREVIERLAVMDAVYRAPSEGGLNVINNPTTRASSEGGLNIVRPDLRAFREGLNITNPVLKTSREGLNIPVPILRASSEGLNMAEPIFRGHSPLANLLVSEQLSKLDTYLQESLDVCLGRKTPSPTVIIKGIGETAGETKHIVSHLYEEKAYSFQSSTNLAGNSVATLDTSYHKEEPVSKTVNVNYKLIPYKELFDKKGKKIDSVNKKKTGVLNAIYNMPIHYHAAILCLLLIIYNLVYQYIKENCLGNKK